MRATQALCDAGAAQGAETLRLQGDVAHDADCRALVAATAKRCGRIDALVNNAGVTSFAGAANWDTVDAETFRHIVGVNALGSFQMIRAAALQLKAAAGSVVNVSSIAGAGHRLVDAARSMTGELLMLDGGMHLGAQGGTTIPGRG